MHSLTELEGCMALGTHHEVGPSIHYFSGTVGNRLLHSRTMR